jgi:hypothetical protein
MVFAFNVSSKLASHGQCLIHIICEKSTEELCIDCQDRMVTTRAKSRMTEVLMPMCVGLTI